jgi:NAD+ diphosphatase
VSRFPLPFVPALEPPAPEERPALFFAFRRRELLVAGASGLPSATALDELGLPVTGAHYLGELEDTPCWAVDLPADAAAPPGMQFLDLRALFGRLPDALHGVAGRAVQIVEWDRTHRFCGACGAGTVPVAGERARRCPDCGLLLYPRLAPSMIVAVERADQILLARSPHFPPGIFSVLAGFVEPGESVEECVRREVYEETRIVVDEIRWFGSQPWPYPHSLMLGFQARYASGEIQPDGIEVVEAGWFRADDMPMFFPGRFSISQWLIHDFLERQRPLS